MSTVYETVEVDSTSIITPAYIGYPNVRMQIPSGSICQGDTLTITYSLTDSTGGVKTIADNEAIVTFTAYPSDPAKEVLGVVYASFVDSNKG